MGRTGSRSSPQPLDLEAELAQPFLREIDLSVFKGIDAVILANYPPANITI